MHNDTDSDAGPQLALRWLYDGPVHTQFLRSKVYPEGIACWYVRRGTVTIISLEQTCTATTGEWIFPARHDARQEHAPGTVLLALRINANPSEKVWPVPRYISIILPRNKGRRLFLLAEDLVRSCKRGSVSPHDPLCAWMRQRALIAWLVEAVRLLRSSNILPIYGNPDPRIATMLAWLREPGQKFSTVRLTRAFGLSRSQINRLLTGATGKTARQLWEKERWCRIESALQRPEASPKTIALDHGFQSLPEFSRWVRRQTGKSPRAWRATISQI